MLKAESQWLYISFIAESRVDTKWNNGSKKFWENSFLSEKRGLNSPQYIQRGVELPALFMLESLHATALLIKRVSDPRINYSGEFALQIVTESFPSS